MGKSQVEEVAEVLRKPQNQHVLASWRSDGLLHQCHNLNAPRHQVYIYIYMYIYICMYVCMYVYVNIWVYIHTVHTYQYIYIYILHASVYIYTHV